MMPGLLAAGQDARTEATTMLADGQICYAGNGARERMQCLECLARARDRMRGQIHLSDSRDQLSNPMFFLHFES